MPSYSGYWLYLGNYTGIPIDDDDYPSFSEARSLEGFTSSSIQNPSYGADNRDLAIVEVTWTYVDNSDNLAYVNNGSGPASVGSYDLGSGPVNSDMNYTANYRAEFILGDGSVVEDGISIVQYENGDIFVRPSSTLQTELTTLEWPISGIRITEHVETSSGRTGYNAFGGPRTFETEDGDIPDITPCLTAGTLVDTERGLVAVEDLRIGDMIRTQDHGFRPLIWTGSRTIPVDANSAPIVFKAGTLNNSRDLSVSPAHRMLITGWKAEMLFGSSEVLVAAADLVNGDTVYADTSRKAVTYFHLMFDRHEVIFAEGAATESLHIGSDTFDRVTEAQREEILAVFPELRQNHAAHGESARRVVAKQELPVLDLAH